MSARAGADLSWRESGSHHVPFWLYTNPEHYQRELEQIFYGESWCYIGLEAEVREVGEFKRSWLGERPVILVRDKDRAPRVLENQCAHRGLEVCQQSWGRTRSFRCPYHQWTYRLDGSLAGLAGTRSAIPRRSRTINRRPPPARGDTPHC